MQQEITEMNVNGVIYVPKSTQSQMAQDFNGMPYVLVRTYSAGVHVGYQKSRIGKEIVLVNSRRIWYWSGANSLSQLAMEGVTYPKDCKFTMPVNEITLTEAIEVIPISEAAKINIAGVKEWKM